jgi:hypothetical protein
MASVLLGDLGKMARHEGGMVDLRSQSRTFHRHQNMEILDHHLSRLETGSSGSLAFFVHRRRTVLGPCSSTVLAVALSIACSGTRPTMKNKRKTWCHYTLQTLNQFWCEHEKKNKFTYLNGCTRLMNGSGAIRRARLLSPLNFQGRHGALLAALLVRTACDSMSLVGKNSLKNIYRTNQIFLLLRLCFYRDFTFLFSYS